MYIQPGNPTTRTIRVGLDWISILGRVGFIFLNPNWIGSVSGSWAERSGWPEPNKIYKIIMKEDSFILMCLPEWYSDLVIFNFFVLFILFYYLISFCLCLILFIYIFLINYNCYFLFLCFVYIVLFILFNYLISFVFI